MIDRRAADVRHRLVMLGRKAVSVKAAVDNECGGKNAAESGGHKLEKAEFKEILKELEAVVDVLSQVQAKALVEEGDKRKQNTEGIYGDLKRCSTSLGIPVTSDNAEQVKVKLEAISKWLQVLVGLGEKAGKTVEQKADIGVLFVHGIGEQPKGDTLTRFGDPLVEWIARWLEKKSGQLSEFTSTLNVRAPVAMEPAHASFKTTLSSNSKSWILAETWWAEEFEHPPLGKLAMWLLTRGPWLILDHFRIPRHWAIGWKFFNIFLFPLSLLCGFAFQLFILTILTLALIPVANVRTIVSRILLAVTGTIGDSYVWAESAIQRGAIITSVERDLTWLMDKCSDVVVVAHSQGAAVAHAVLKDVSRPEIKAFVSCGAGLRKLHQLKKERDGRGYSSLSTGLLAFILGLLGIVLRTADNEKIICWSLLIIAVYVIINFVLWLSERDPIGGELGLRLKWFDFYASSDPVPNGTLGIQDSATMKSLLVWNLRSFTKDHTAYWDNKDQFVAQLVQIISEATSAGLVSMDDGTTIKKADSWRKWKTFLLPVSRLITLAVLVMGLYCARESLEQAGRNVGSMLKDWLPSALINLERLCREVLAFIAPMSMDTIKSVEYIFLGGFELVVVILAFHVFAKYFWHLLDERLTHYTVFSKVDDKKEIGVSAIFLFLAWLGVIVLQILLLQRLWTQTDLTQIFMEERTAVIHVFLLFLVMLTARSFSDLTLKYYIVAVLVASMPPVLWFFSRQPSQYPSFTFLCWLIAGVLIVSCIERAVSTKSRKGGAA